MVVQENSLQFLWGIPQVFEHTGYNCITTSSHSFYRITFILLVHVHTWGKITIDGEKGPLITWTETILVK
jgi:hypothetical protein